MNRQFALLAVILAASLPLIAGAQTRTSTAPAATRPAAKADPATCAWDSGRALDGQTWCRRGSLHQCNATSGQWTNLGKKCP